MEIIESFFLIISLIYVTDSLLWARLFIEAWVVVVVAMFWWLVTRLVVVSLSSDLDIEVFSKELE